MAEAKDYTEEEMLENFFELVDKLINELGVEDLPNHFYNLDKIGLA